MSVIPGFPRRAIGAAILLPLWLAAADMASAQNYWLIDGPVTSPETTGTTEAPFSLDDLPTAEEQMPEALRTGQVNTPDAPEVDESALRYFAERGDTRRLEIEIARLRALYPDWVPPADPLAAPVNVDERLEEIWRLYSEGRLGEARRAIAQRQADEPGWQPPADLIDRLTLAEARERLVNASEIDQHGTVIAIASENPHLLTCGEVDVLWRVAEAFARTEREPRARDAYRYILANCDNPQERLATVQNASRLLPQPLLDELLAMERVDASGAGEFTPVRNDLARDAVARGGEDAAATVPAEQIARVERLARDGDLASDARLLGWYHLQRENHSDAEEWFRMALEREASADASEGLALALIARGQNAEAEAVMHRWRGENANTRKVYLAAVANLLGEEPRPTLSQEVLGRIVAEVAASRDVPSARQLGWYARAWEQHQTAGQWFTTALRWDPDDEPSAYGLALTRHLLGDTAGLAEIKRIWAGRSERIQQVGTGVTEAPPARPVRPVDPAPRADGEIAYAPAEAPAPRDVAGRTETASRRHCPSYVNPESLSPNAALQRGWCLLDANRPLEAARAFDVALKGRSSATRRDAAWGQSLAYLRAGLVDEAAVAAISAPHDARRANELQTAILAQRAAGAFERGRYVETLIALDQRAQIAAERIDLMVLRGYAYLRLNRLHDARRVFRAAAATGSRDAQRGLAEVQSALNDFD